MKIIGITNAGYILEAEREEVANLVGYYGEYDLKRARDFGVGSTINVHKMYKSLYELKGVESEMENARERLDAVMKLMNIPKPITDAIDTIPPVNQ